jgi:hypothetical protein
MLDSHVQYVEKSGYGAHFEGQTLPLYLTAEGCLGVLAKFATLLDRESSLDPNFRRENSLDPNLRDERSSDNIVFMNFR